MHTSAYNIPISYAASKKHSPNFVSRCQKLQTENVCNRDLKNSNSRKKLPHTPFFTAKRGNARGTRIPYLNPHSSDPASSSCASTSCQSMASLATPKASSSEVSKRLGFSARLLLAGTLANQILIWYPISFKTKSCIICRPRSVLVAPLAVSQCPSRCFIVYVDNTLAVL